MREGPNQERGSRTPRDEGDGAPPSGEAFGGALRARNLGWLVRATGWCALAATVLGAVVAPGLRGYASDATVVAWDTAATVLSYAAAIFACTGAIAGASELALARRADSASGALVVSGTSLVVVLLVVAVIHARRMPDSPPPWQLSMGIALVASSVASTAAWRAMSGPHARALAIAISAFAIAALLRTGAWELARASSERGAMALEWASRGVVTAAVLVEALGQAVSAAWIGVRGRTGMIASSVAAVLAFLVTWGAAVGARAEAPPWAAALHAVIGESSSLPAPFALSAAQSFLAVSAIFLAGAALVQITQPAAVTSAFALALLSRGAFDAPIRAIAIVTAAVWALCAASDPHILWATIGVSRRGASYPARSS
jgi:hypothetical protein